jgi:hypothetical protein
MLFDDIVVGSGLAALGVVLGIPANRRILIIGGLTNGRFVYYNYNRTAFKPSAGSRKSSSRRARETRLCLSG